MDHVLNDIAAIGAEFGVRGIVLFGSRARGDHSLKSDYDIAVLGSLTEAEKARLLDKIDEIETLKKIDLVFVDDVRGSEDLLARIRKEGVVIYGEGGKQDPQLSERSSKTQ